MTPNQIAAVLKKVVDNQLKDTDTAIKAGHKAIALRELEDAVRVLTQLAVHFGGKGR